jgi:hypothetical protein
MEKPCGGTFMARHADGIFVHPDCPGEAAMREWAEGKDEPSECRGGVEDIMELEGSSAINYGQEPDGLDRLDGRFDERFHDYGTSEGAFDDFLGSAEAAYDSENDPEDNPEDDPEDDSEDDPEDDPEDDDTQPPPADPEDEDDPWDDPDPAE